MKPRKPIRKRSPLAQRRQRLYSVIATRFKTEHPLCQACIKVSRHAGFPLKHARWTEDVHHSRGRLGELLFETKFFVAVCRPCHQWIGNNPAAARKLGLLCEKGEWNNPPTPPP